MTPIETLIDEAWRQCYLDPARARALGHELVDRGEMGWGDLHSARAEVRIGNEADALAAAQRARARFEAGGDPTGTALCDEVIAIHHRRVQNVDGCRALHRDIDARPGLRYTPVQDFVAQNSRAITAKLLGEPDEALRRFYAAVDAARRSGLAGCAWRHRIRFAATRSTCASRRWSGPGPSAHARRWPRRWPT